MGRIGDFDFNDIVFDVVQLADGSQTCYVRALGGTVDIAITVGDVTWRKGEKKVINKDGEEEDAVITQMYNTTPPDEEWILAQFPVTGWNPETNNVTVTVYLENETKPGTFYPMVVNFPDDGDVPMMVAVNVTKLWMVEKTSIESMPKDLYNNYLNDNDYSYPNNQ